MTQRSLADWLSYLEQLHPTAIDMGLERSREVARRLGLGRPAKRVVTVTGTNGKGSTCALLAELLREQGLSVGVYSSPHLLRYNERVRIDGVEAGDAQLCDAFSAVEAARGEISLTYFEMGTLAAFWLFERAGLDFAVLEVGLGGRLDAVNLIDADLALITSIGLDHADWLGDTRESVAFEKAGILRAGKPALCGDLDPPQPLLEQVAALGAPLYLRGRDYDLALADHGWHWRGLAADGQALALHDLPLLGDQVEDALALEAGGLVAGVMRRRDQVVGTGGAGGQRLDRGGEVERGVMQHQEAHAFAVGGSGAIAVVVDGQHGFHLFADDGKPPATGSPVARDVDAAMRFRGRPRKRGPRLNRKEEDRA